jgi:hypothetical protein
VALLAGARQSLVLQAGADTRVAAGVDRERDVLAVRLVRDASAGLREALQGDDLVVELLTDSGLVDLLEEGRDGCKGSGHGSFLSVEETRAP